MLKRIIKNALWFLKLSILLKCLIFPPISVKSEELNNNYDIWNDRPQRKKNFDFELSSKTVHNGNKKTSPVHREREGKILSFFYPSTEEECLAQDQRRSGLCLNPYRCHQKGGTSSGTCAHGFGVCCVFTATCGNEIKNNITYFVSPEFPSLARSMDSCALTVHKMEGAFQLRLDFVHFNLGQPNRLTGECDSDLFILSGGSSRDFRLCGTNSGQHIYYDIDKKVKFVTIKMRLTRPTLQRLWEIRVTQIPFGQRAPADCLQYFTTVSGTLQSFNFAENGRHLADQNYKTCVRQGKGMCSIAYEPCDEDSFRIGPSLVQGNQYGMVYGGPADFGGGPGFFGGGGPFGGGPGAFGGSGTEFINGPVQGVGEVQDSGDLQMVGDPINDNNEIVGSGDGSVAMRSDDDNSSPPALYQNPYSQFLSSSPQSDTNHDLWRYSGYGNYGQGVSSFGRLGCRDRIVTPCDGDEFLGTTSYSPGSCDPYHCGLSLCQGRQQGRGPRPPCRVETSATPFFVAVRFGPPAPKPNPEANIGMCLKFEQVPCA